MKKIKHDKKIKREGKRATEEDSCVLKGSLNDALPGKGRQNCTQRPDFLRGKESHK